MVGAIHGWGTLMSCVTKHLQKVLILLLTCIAGVSNAQIPVTDVLGLTQQIQQVAAWSQQYTQMASQLANQAQQIQNQVEQIKSVTGGRGMGGLAQNMLRQELPADYLNTYDRLRSLGSSGASNGARSILATIKGADCSAKFPLDQQLRMRCEASQLALPQNIDFVNGAIAAAKQRQTQLTQLASSIDTTDSKAAADLTNRMLQEMTLLQNEKMLIDMALKQQQQQLALSQQQSAAEGARRINRSSAGSVNAFNLD